MMSDETEFGYRVNYRGTHWVLVKAKDEHEAEEKLHSFYSNKVENEGLWSYEIDKGPTDRYEDSADVRLITPKDY
jgi:hypothetical protein